MDNEFIISYSKAFLKVNIDESVEEHIIYEDFQGEFHENLFHDLVADDILDPDINKNIPNMEGDR